MIKIRHFINGWNDRTHPFIWTKSADESCARSTVKRLQRQTTSWSLSPAAGLSSIYALMVAMRQEDQGSSSQRGLLIRIESLFESGMENLAPARYVEADRREVDPPIEVETATWSAGGTLDWWVKERREWFGRVRGKDGRQHWIRATDLRPKEGC